MLNKYRFLLLEDTMVKLGSQTQLLLQLSWPGLLTHTWDLKMLVSEESRGECGH